MKNWCLQIVLEKTLESPLGSKIKNQPWIFIRRTVVELELQYSGYLLQRVDSLEKTLMLGKIKGKRGQRQLRWLDRVTDSTDMNLSKLWEIVKDREAWQAEVHCFVKSQIWLATEQEQPFLVSSLQMEFYEYFFSESFSVPSHLFHRHRTEEN